MDKQSVYRSPEGKEMILSEYRKTLERWPVSCTHHDIETSAGNIFAIESGDSVAPLLILLHGTSGNSASWMGDIPVFAGKFHTICVDMPGQPGLSSEIRVPLSDSGIISWISDVMDYFKMETASFVGVSLGGWMALRFAVSFPERVKALSLNAASGLAEARISFIFKALWLLMQGEKGSDRLYRLISHKVELPEEMIHFGRLVSRHFLAITEAPPVVRGDQLKKIADKAVQYFGGNCDVLLNTEKSISRLKEFIPESEINFLEDTGHVIVGIAEDIVCFLTELAAG